MHLVQLLLLLFQSLVDNVHLGQVEDKSREIERLRGSLGTAEARLGGLEGRLLSS